MICGKVLEAVSDIYSTVCSIAWLYESINHSQMEWAVINMELFIKLPVIFTDMLFWTS
jgi:hypothetical protein